MSNVAFPAEFDEFFRFELTSIVGSETLQFPIGLVFDPIFGSDWVSPHLPSRVVNKADEVRCTTKLLMWHRATDVRADQIERARFSWC